MPNPTTIRVPSDLRDRIAARARAKGTTLAVAITEALDASEDELFWSRVREDHAITAGSPVTDPYDEGGLRDHLDPADDAVAREDW